MSHKHPVIDDDNVLIIDPITRNIQNQNDFPEKILQGDHNCEKLTFQIPLYVDGHDMTQCNLVRVHFVNIGEDNQKIFGIEDIMDIRRDEYDPDIALCSWLISGKATRLVGKLHFCIQFACVEDGLITYSWSTAICTKLMISSSMDNTEIDDDYNKTINDVPFTVDDKNKLDGLPTGEELEELINSGGGGMTPDQVNELIQSELSEFSEMTFDPFILEYDQFVINVNDSIEHINNQIGDIDSALDELHNYAQALILPIEDEIDEIIDIQNELIGGDA